MFSDVSIVIAFSTGLFGAVSTLLIGNRYTRNLALLGWGGVASGIALATLSYVIASWCVHGFEPLRAWILPPAGLILLLVMSAQNWFVFYEDHADAAQSARPALVVLAAMIATICSAWFGAERALALQVIWAGAISLAILLSIRPVSRSIELNGSTPIGMLIGVCKLLAPATGIIVFVLAGGLSRARHRAQAEDGTEAKTPAPAALAAEADRAVAKDPHLQAPWINLLLLCWEIGSLPLLTLINGARVVREPAWSDPVDLLFRQKGTGSVAGQMPRAARDTVVLILVLAVHVLCGVVMARD